MIRPPLLFIFLSLSHLVQGSSVNSTSSECPSPDSATYRSVWGILGSCALTLVICLWHAVHPNVPAVEAKGYETLLERVTTSLVWVFLAPEITVALAADEWGKVRCIVEEFKERGYQWSKTHGHFAETGGFVYRDEGGGTRTIDSLEFLQLCEDNKIINPAIKEKEIKDRSKSDAIGKAILSVQLLWFILQVTVRGAKGLAITLAELDTVAMAALTLTLLFFCWDKPLRANCPCIFYSSQEGRLEPLTDTGSLKDAWEPEQSSLSMPWSRPVHGPKIRSAGDWEDLNTRCDMATSTTRRWFSWVMPPWDQWRSRLGIGLTRDLPSDKIDRICSELEAHIIILEYCPRLPGAALFGTWVVLGMLHLIAWDFYFQTEIEKIIWRGASLALTGSPLAIIVSYYMLLPSTRKAIGSISHSRRVTFSQYCVWLANFVSINVTTWLVIGCRGLLLALMLASLRGLPCSAHEIVPWTAYIPHL